MAEALYQSPLFWGTKNYAETRCDTWYILSAKYGLVSPRQIIEPYDKSLFEMTDAQRERWATEIYESLRKKIGPATKIVFLAGNKYRAYIQKFAEIEHRATAAPLSTLGIGRQVSWLQKLPRQCARLSDLDRLYVLLERVQVVTGIRTLKEFSAETVRARKGLYFFFEPDEFRMTKPFEQRIVRVGTHAVSAGSKSTLWNRLRTHRGGFNGLGNHRGSIFRLHVGESLIRKAGLEAVFPNWGVGQTSSELIRNSEQEVELEVSEVIGNMRVLWLEIPDEPSPDSDRSYLERNVIALLCGPSGPLDLQK